MKKRILCLILSISVISGLINLPFAYAEEEQTQEEVILYDESAVEEDSELVVTEHTEIISADKVNPADLEEDTGVYINTRETLVESTNSNARSSLIESNKTLWETIMAEQFGAEFFTPYKSRRGEHVADNTNKLKINETDLSLPGRNGLDLNIRRSYDNQYTPYYGIYRLKDDGENIILKLSSYRFVYAFTRSDTNGTIYIAFHTEDEFYKYMYNGCKVSALTAETFKSGEKTIYLFDGIYSKISNSGTIQLTYDDSIPCTYTFYKEDALYEVLEYDINYKLYSIGDGWYYDFPYSVSVCDELTQNTTNYYTEKERDFSGVFRDIDGVLHTYYANHYLKTIEETGETEFKSQYISDDYYNISYTRYYEDCELEDGTKYNFEAIDLVNNITYYMYATTNVMKSKQRVKVVQVRDDYNNKIQYNYASDEDYIISQIIDTYGREINVSAAGIAYKETPDGEERTITYTKEVLPADTLNNDSYIKPKDVNRFTVTNENGERTVYDARITQMITGAPKTTTFSVGRPNSLPAVPAQYTEGYNIERIVYPSGMEKHYKYIDTYYGTTNPTCTRSLYSVEASYEKYGDTIVNEKTYSMTGSSARTITAKLAGGGMNVREYDTYGRLTQDYMRSESSVVKLTGAEYTYDDNNNIKTVTEYTDGKSKTTSYTYNVCDLIETETVGNKKIQYSYHGLSNLPSEINVYKKNGSSFVLDYTVITEIDFSKVKITSLITKKDDTQLLKIAYEYDDYGELISQKEWVNDTNSDGVLDDTDEYIVSKRETTVGNDLLVTVKDYVENVTDADGTDIGTVAYEYKYNIFGSPVRAKDGEGNITTVSYDKLNRPVLYKYSNGAEVAVEYSLSDLTATVTDAYGIKTRQKYDVFGNVTEISKLDGEEWKPVSKSEYNDKQGRLTKYTQYTTANAGTVTEYTYDAVSRPLTEKVFDFSNNLLYTNTYTYGLNGGYIFSGKNTAHDGINSIANSYYNVYGELVKEEVSDGTNTYANTYTYDYMSRPLTVTDPKGNVTTNTYDTLGNLLTVKDPLGKIVTSTYDLLGNQISVTDQKGNTSNIYYDKLGRTVKAVSPEGSTVKQYYDKNSRVIKQAVQNNKPGETESFAVTETKYDSMGNIVGVISDNGDNDKVTRYEYDLVGNPLKMITGLYKYADSEKKGSVVTYLYNDMRQLIGITDPMGMSEGYTYDYLGNVLTSTDRNGKLTEYTYSAHGITKQTTGDMEISNVYNNIGQLLSTTTVDGQNTDTVSYTYDGFGRVTKETEGGYTNNYTYDAASNLTGYTLKQGETDVNTLTYDYDALNRLTKITNGDIITSYTYDAVGNLTGKTHGGFSSSYTYDKNGNITDLVNSYNGTPVEHFTYGYLLDGNRYSEVRENGAAKEYTYDNFGQLTSEVITDNGAKTSYKYEYDNFGNRITLTTIGSQNTVVSYEYDKNNRLLGYCDNSTGYGKRYSYDNNGNRTLEIGWQFRENLSYEPGIETSAESDYKYFEYDEINRLISVSTMNNEYQYAYNANGLRKSKSVNGVTTNYIWNNGNMVAEANSTGITALYNYDMTGIMSSEINNAVNYYTKNAHGDVTGLYTSDGTAAASYLYDAYGNQLTENANDINPFRYSGEFYDEETDNIYLRNRYYDTSTGRFITEDPIRDGLNWYAYCENNPIMLVDLLGLDPIPEWARRVNTGRGTNDDFWQALNTNPNSYGGFANIVVSNAVASAQIAHRSTYFSQTDSRWTGVPYTITNDRTQTIGTSGCGITSMAMVISTLTGEDVDPTVVGKYSVENGFRTENNGTASGLYASIGSEYGLTASDVSWGFDGSKMSLVFDGETMVITSLQKGNVATGGHIVVTTGVTERNGQTYFIVYDPNYNKAKNKYSGGVIDAGNGKIYVPESVMEKDVKYTVTISK